MKKICILTGTRAEYGILKPIMVGVKNHPDFNLSLIVTGMHLSEEFGSTIDYIKQDGFKIDEKFEMHEILDDNFSMAQSVGKGIIGAANALKNIKPDLLIVLGDRTEALAASIASAYMNIPIAHFSGGDRTGGIDESVRHAITKFAHIHFPATKESAKRIEKMGEDSWRIHVVGEPSLEKICNMEFLSKKEFEKKFDLNLDEPLIILLQHSNTIESNKAGEQINETLESIKELGYQTVIIYPNSDSGGREIITQINQFAKLDFVRIYKSLSHEEFLNLLYYATVLVGNSSSGLTEAPSFQLPVVNIGTRQKNRERGINVIDVDYDKDQIIKGIRKTLFDKNFQKKMKNRINPYGDGNTSQKVLKILASLKIDSKLLHKYCTY